MSNLSSSSKPKRLIISALILVLIIAGTFVIWRKQRLPETTYTTVKVVRGSINVSVLSTGVVEPENRLEIKPPIAGRIDQVLVDEGDQVQKSQILAWMSSTERAGLLDAARAKGPQELKRWEEFYKPTPILAPIPGTIILRNVEPGQTFTNQDPVLVMSDRLTVKAQVDETDIAQIQLNQKAEINLDAYANEKLSAQVLQIAFDAKTVNNVTTYVVDVLPDNTPSFMRSGMTANVTFFVNAKSAVLVAPSEAVTMSDEKSFVLTKHAGDKGRPTRTEVTLGLSDGKHVEIVSGLTEGQLLFVPQLRKPAAQGSSPFTPFGTKRGAGH